MKGKIALLSMNKLILPSVKCQNIANIQGSQVQSSKLSIIYV